MRRHGWHASAGPAEDPFADSFPVFAGGFGIKIDKAAATPHLNGVRSISLELLAAVGPMSILVLLSMMLEKIDRLPARVAPTMPRASPTAPTVAAPPATTEPPAPVLDPRELRRQQKEEKAADLQRRHDLFVADELETYSGVSMPTDEPWQMWRARRAARREDAGDQRSFSQRLRANFTHDPNNGRPRFLNVRAKVKATKLTVVR